MKKPIHCDDCKDTRDECPCRCHPFGVAWREAKRLRLAAIGADE